jgi:hypothetical protein
MPMKKTARTKAKQPPPTLFAEFKTRKEPRPFSITFGSQTIRGTVPIRIYGSGLSRED